MKEKQIELDSIIKSHPMEYLFDHPFFMIRKIERSRRKLLIKTIAAKEGEIIADVGCERGHILSQIYRNCPKVGKLYGIDLSKHAISEAKDLAEWDGWKNKAEFLCCDAREIAMPDNSVDVAISSNVLEHLPDPQKGFDELLRITKPGGRIILNLPNEKRIIKLKRAVMKLGLKRLLGNIKLITPGHLHAPDKKFVYNLCKGKCTVKMLFLGPKISLLGLYIYAVISPNKKEQK